MGRCVVTGGAGFLGSHLTEKLLREKHEVVVLDNLITGSLRNIEHLGGNPLFLFKKENVSEAVLVDGQVDFIFHFASPASPIDYLEFPIPTLKVGAMGTHNALGAAKVKKAGFLLASTSEVYGDPLEHPQKETYWGNVNPIGPRGVYDEAKRYAESITMAYHRCHKIPTRIARIFNTYGPRMRLKDGRIVPNFLSQALRGEDLTVYGNGLQTRSFCFVDDLIEGIYALFQKDFHDPVNLGNPTELTVLEFAETIIRMTKSSSKIKYFSLPEDDPKVRKPDIQRAEKVLGWRPKTSLEEGLEKTIYYFKKEMRQ
ncbi:MAG: SDR family oxidoreductase [Candidatus Aureabacteria bacterium]|nr:SDR family oxidoreductase [Candidatus Auribacterota bacterium]